MSKLLRRKIWAALMLLPASAAAYADFDCSGGRGGFRMQTNDAWFGRDKLKHFGGLGAWLARDTEHPVIHGALIDTLPGLIKEGIDGTCRNDGFSYRI